MIESDITNIVPQLSVNAAFYPFDKQTYVVQQTAHAHQLRVNQATYQLLCLVNGKRTIEEITATYNQSLSIPISVKDVYNTLFEQLSKWGIIEDTQKSQQEFFNFDIKNGLLFRLNLGVNMTIYWFFIALFLHFFKTLRLTFDYSF